MDEINICGLCNKEYKGYGNNPAPLICKGRACDDCNITKVIRQRMVNSMRFTEEDLQGLEEALATLSRKCN